MRGILFSILTGLVGAALLHIIIILAVPEFTGRDAYTKVLSFGEPNRFFSLPNEAGSGAALVNDDPYLHAAVCAFSVADGPVRFRAPGGVPLWTFAIFDTGANEVFSMNDNTSVTGGLDLVAATPVQLVGLRKVLPEALSQSVLAEMRGEEGYAVLRALAPMPSFEEAARTFLAEAGCDPLAEGG